MNGVARLSNRTNLVKVSLNIKGTIIHFMCIAIATAVDAFPLLGPIAP
jgi:hypothetical protein